MDLEHKWLQAKTATVGQAAVKLDIEVDRAISGLVDYLRVSAAAPVDTPTKAPARRLLEELFPAGPLGVIHLAHEEEAAAIDELLGHMSGDLAAEVTALSLAPYVERITELNAALKAELLKKPKDSLSFDVLRAAQENGQAMLLQTVARILGAFPGTGEDEKKRAALLGPIWRQNEDVRQSRRRRRQASDVNPDTGVVLDTLPAPDLGTDTLPS